MSDYDIRILACQPVSTDRMQALGLPLEGLPTVTDLFHKERCESCVDEVWVGPRQTIARELSEVPTHVLCYVCALIAQDMSAAMGTDLDIVPLGGGPTVEGTPIQQPPEEEPVPYACLRPEEFPFTVEIFREDTGEILWHEAVTGPGALSIPGFGGQGFLVGVRVTTAGGRIDTYLGSELADEPSN